MKTESSLTSAQITALFTTHGVAQNPSIARFATGFTNAVYAVDDCILKVCIDTRNEAHFEREGFLYGALRGLARMPEPFVVDTSKTLLPWFYMIYRRIEGEPAGQRWHLLKEEARRQFIADLCQPLRRIDAFPREETMQRFELRPNPVWKEEVEQGLLKSLAAVRERALLPESTLHEIERYIGTRAAVLGPQKLGLTFWDVQFDNMLIDGQNRLAGLIDFEGIGVTSLDFRLMIVRAMSERPHLFLSEAMEPYARVEDYASLMAWYREFYPELFDFPDLERRLDLYELGDILDHLPAWPSAKQLHHRLTAILNR